MPTITTVYKGDMLFETQIGSHTVVSDVPAKMGGKDRAPTPPQMFVASLGACIGAFVAAYCGSSGINNDDLKVDVSFDMADNPTRMRNIQARVYLPQGSCKGREKAVHRAAEHCPVHSSIDLFDGLDIEIVDSEKVEGEAT